MKERPILFSGEMVRAILEGRKTMTRRVVKFGWNGTAGELMAQSYFDRAYKFPYGQVGDRLWVRETFGICSGLEPCKPEPGYKIYYRATMDSNDGTPAQEEGIENGWPVAKWRPSIFMPRWASRITLEITSVRVERLQDITEEDAKAEGMESLRKYSACTSVNYISFYSKTLKRHVCTDCVKKGFVDLWRTINGPESWDANPWVWVVGFKRVKEQHEITQTVNP